MDSSMELLEKARGAYKAIQDELAGMREELSPLIDTLDRPLERTAMRERYIEGRSVREIAYSIAYSEPHVFEVLRHAEQKMMGNCEKS